MARRRCSALMKCFLVPIAAASVCLMTSWGCIADDQDSSDGYRVPVLLDVAPGVAAAHPELIKRHNTLMDQRKALRDLRATHNGKCRSVEKDSPDYNDCLSSRAKLLADLKRHITDSDDYNANIRSAQDYCVKFAGYDLIFAFRDCENKQPSVISIACLKGIGISPQALACLGALAGATKGLKGTIAILASCGAAAVTVPADPPLKCRDIKDACVAKALQNHKDGVVRCLP